MALEHYLVSEIALDHEEGLLSRREALRLLVLMGLGTTAAATLLDTTVAAAASKTTKATTKTTTKKTTSKRPTTKKGATTTPSVTPSTTGNRATSAPTTAGSGGPAPLEDQPLAGDGPALPTSMITFPGPTTTLRGAFAAPTSKALGAVLIIHENRGLTDHFKALPGRFARDGYAALAIDLASRAGGTDAVAAQMPAPLSNTPTADLVADLRAGIDELVKRAPGLRVGVIGFCFGGGMTWSLLAAGEPRISAAAPFYGPGPDGANFSGSKNAAVLAVYAELDARVNASRPAMEAALKAGGLNYQVRVFPGVDHAFFNDTGARYDPTQAAAAYEAVLGWFRKHLGPA